MNSLIQLHLGNGDLYFSMFSFQKKSGREIFSIKNTSSKEIDFFSRECHLKHLNYTKDWVALYICFCLFVSFFVLVRVCKYV